MRKLKAPVDDPSAVYALCISKVRDPALKDRLQNVVPQVAAAAATLKAAGVASTFYQLAPSPTVGVVTCEEMTSVYDYRMARKRAPGRPVYDRLIAATPHMRCPLCGQRVVSTLDHYMPKSAFPALAVVPLNLIPACADCNKKKLALVANTAVEQTLHPYFDDVDGEIWLRAEVIENSPPALRYFVDAPAAWSAVTRARIQHHFTIFQLAALYASHAGEELENIRYSMETLLEQAGEEAIREELRAAATSRENAHLNSWQAAMYRALAASDWYCAGGFAA